MARRGADHSLVISPDVFNRARCSQIIDRLQNHVRPDLFQNRSIYDGRKILYAAGKPLRLVNSEGQSVCCAEDRIYTILKRLRSVHS
jgi:hypothetical protein